MKTNFLSSYSLRKFTTNRFTVNNCTLHFTVSVQPLGEPVKIFSISRIFRFVFKMEVNQIIPASVPIYPIGVEIQLTNLTHSAANFNQEVEVYQMMMMMESLIENNSRSSAARTGKQFWSFFGDEKEESKQQVASKRRNGQRHSV